MNSTNRRQRQDIFFLKQEIDMKPRFPHVEVELVGHDGNAFAILDTAKKAMRRADVDRADIDTMMTEAMSGDYDHLLQTVMATVTVC